MVVAIALAVGRNVDELGARAFLEAGQKAGRHRVPRPEEPVEGNGVRDRPVVEEERELPAGSHLAPIRPARVQCGRAGPPVTSGLAHARRLARCQEREPDPLVGQHFQGLAIHGGFG